MKTAISVLFLIAVAAVAGFAAPMPVIANGGFDAGASTAGPFQTNVTGSTIPGWTVVSGNVDWIYTYWNPAGGTHSLDMNGTQAGAIMQTVDNLVAGQRYTVTWYQSTNPEIGADDAKPLLVRVGEYEGGTWGDYAEDTKSVTQAKLQNNAPFTITWHPQSFTFTAGEGFNTLYFASLYNGGVAAMSGYCGPTLDSVSISLATVPEPGLTLLFGTLVLALPFARRLAKR